MLLTILFSLGELLPGLLAKVGVAPSIDTLIETVFTAGHAIFSAVKSGESITPVLSALQTALAAVQQDKSTDPVVLAELAESIRVLQAAIAAYQAAQTTTDPSTLTPLPKVV